MRLTKTQHDFLSLIEENTVHEDGDTSKPLTRFWCPQLSQYSGRQWCEALGYYVYATGAGIAASLKSMERRGWLESKRTMAYAYAITEEGRIALEAHREATGFYAREGSRQ